MDHGSHATSTNAKALKISAVLILVYFVFEIAVAIFTGSLSLLADAAHELSTFIAIGLSLVAMKLASTPPTPTRTFGFLRIEVLAALMNGLLLLVMAAFIIVQGIERINHPMEVPSTPMFIMAIGGIGLEVASLVNMFKGQKNDLNIRGSFWHVVNAFLGSLAVIIAALFIKFGEIYVADAWAGLFFAIILIYAAYGIIKDSVRILIDVTPNDVDMTKLAGELRKISGVKETHHFHARTITSQMKVFSGHLVVTDIGHSDRILKEAKAITDHKYGFNLSTIQIETNGLAEADPKSLESQV